jgi:hypothetical protein
MRSTPLDVLITDTEKCENQKKQGAKKITGFPKKKKPEYTPFKLERCEAPVYVCPQKNIKNFD